jgi:hypothetical protein
VTLAIPDKLVGDFGDAILRRRTLRSFSGSSAACGLRASLFALAMSLSGASSMPATPFRLFVVSDEEFVEFVSWFWAVG